MSMSKPRGASRGSSSAVYVAIPERAGGNGENHAILTAQFYTSARFWGTTLNADTIGGLSRSLRLTRYEE